MHLISFYQVMQVGVCSCIGNAARDPFMDPSLPFLLYPVGLWEHPLSRRLQGNGELHVPDTP